MSWIYLIIAGIFEVFGVIWLNQLTKTGRKFYVILMTVTFTLSFLTLKLAMNDIPMGTAYAI